MFSAKILAFALLVEYGFCATDVLREFARENRQFTAAVYKTLLPETQGNFLVCPISVTTVMALASVGSKGETAQQISRGLGLSESQDEVSQVFRELTPLIRGNQFYALSSANRLFVKEGFQVNRTYQQLAEQNFDAGIDSVDFSKKVAASQRINAWVEQKTNNKIRNLVAPDEFSASTRLVLVNALHFRARWQKPFDVFDTSKLPFYTLAGGQQMVDMMRVTDFFNYYESKDLDCKFLELRYEGGDISMVIALPNQKDGLPLLERHADDVFKLQPFSKEQVRVFLPKFAMETSVQFKPILQKLGIKRVFTSEADLSGISPTKPSLFIDKVVQKTFINITEKGTEAAAATAGGVVTLSIPASDKNVRIEFNVNHPCLMYIHYINRPGSSHGPAVLFAGRLMTPQL